MRNGFWKAQIFLGLLVFGVMIMPSLALAQSSRDVNNRLNRIENELETLGRAVYKGEMPPPGTGGASSASSADAEIRIQQLESEIRTLTGRIEEQDYQVRQLRQQLDKLTADIDMRLGDMQHGGAASGGFVNGTDGGQYQGSSQSSPQQAAPMPSDSGGGYQWNSGSSSQGSSGQLGTLNETGGGGDGAAATLYENAFSLLKGAQYAEAEKEFISFLGQYPDHALAGNATYWLGETYYVRGQFEKAAKTFAEGYQKDPKGAKAADNLLKMGMSLSGMNKKSDACVALGQIEKQFPSSGPVVRRAQQEMTRLGC